MKYIYIYRVVVGIYKTLSHAVFFPKIRLKDVYYKLSFAGSHTCNGYFMGS